MKIIALADQNGSIGKTATAVPFCHGQPLHRRRTVIDPAAAELLTGLERLRSEA